MYWLSVIMGCFMVLTSVVILKKTSKKEKTEETIKRKKDCYKIIVVGVSVIIAGVICLIGQ